MARHNLIAPLIPIALFLRQRMNISGRSRRRLQYILNTTRDSGSYDLAKDPAEVTNIAHQQRGKPIASASARGVIFRAR